jgi:hypothetical protein
MTYFDLTSADKTFLMLVHSMAEISLMPMPLTSINNIRRKIAE